MSNELAEKTETVTELESALTEMASHLEHAKIDHDDMKDLHEGLTGGKWVDEKTVKTCSKCERDFTLKRRKVKISKGKDKGVSDKTAENLQILSKVLL